MKLLTTHADNNVKLIVIDRLEAIKKRCVHVTLWLMLQCSHLLMLELFLNISSANICTSFIGITPNPRRFLGAWDNFLPRLGKVPSFFEFKKAAFCWRQPIFSTVDKICEHPTQSLILITRKNPQWFEYRLSRHLKVMVETNFELPLAYFPHGPTLLQVP